MVLREGYPPATGDGVDILQGFVVPVATREGHCDSQPSTLQLFLLLLVISDTEEQRTERNLTAYGFSQEQAGRRSPKAEKRLQAPSRYFIFSFFLALCGANARRR